MNNDTEKVVVKPDTMGAILKERLKEIGGEVPLHKLNRKARREHYRKTGERVIGSNLPRLNPDKIRENVLKLLMATAKALGLRYSHFQKGLVDRQGKVVRAIDFDNEVKEFKKRYGQ